MPTQLAHPPLLVKEGLGVVELTVRKVNNQPNLYQPIGVFYATGPG